MTETLRPAMVTDEIASVLRLGQVVPLGRAGQQPCRLFTGLCEERLPFMLLSAFAWFESEGTHLRHTAQLMRRVVQQRLSATQLLGTLQNDDGHTTVGIRFLLILLSEALPVEMMLLLSGFRTTCLLWGDGETVYSAGCDNLTPDDIVCRQSGVTTNGLAIAISKAFARPGWMFAWRGWVVPDGFASSVAMSRAGLNG
ncbi:MAG: hypothetical protein ACYDBB_04785 [Armatimonadota bacterium]